MAILQLSPASAEKPAHPGCKTTTLEVFTEAAGRTPGRFPLDLNRNRDKVLPTTDQPVSPTGEVRTPPRDLKRIESCSCKNVRTAGGSSRKGQGLRKKIAPMKRSFPPALLLTAIITLVGLFVPASLSKRGDAKAPESEQASQENGSLSWTGEPNTAGPLESPTPSCVPNPSVSSSAVSSADPRRTVKS